MKQARAALAADDAATAVSASRDLATMLDDMVTKEEKVLFPMAIEHADRGRVGARSARGEEEVGYALIADVPSWPAGRGGRRRRRRPPARTPRPSARHRTQDRRPHAEQLNRRSTSCRSTSASSTRTTEVRYLQRGRAHLPALPGCHRPQGTELPPAGERHKVQEIVDAFRAGDKDVAEFWLEIGGKFLHIRYFALHDADGTYKGTVEIVQDVTHIRALEGQRRLVDW